MIEYLSSLDNQLMLLLNGYHTGFMDRAMMMFTGRFIWIPMYIALFVVLVRTFRGRTLIFYLIGIALTITLADQLCATVIRPLVGRLRPSNLENPLSQFVYIVNSYRGGAYGFPSCHAANSFALAAFVTLVFRNRLISYVVVSWAIVNSYSRLYLGVHYPGDLLVGAVIGISIAYGCYRLSRFFIKETSGESLQRYKAPVFSGRMPMHSDGGSITVDITIGRIFSGIVLLTVLVITLFAI